MNHQFKILKQARLVFDLGHVPCPQSHMKQCPLSALNTPPAHYCGILSRPDLLLKMLQDTKLYILFGSNKMAFISFQIIHLILQREEENLL